jgi:hypothetical protein
MQLVGNGFGRLVRQCKIVRIAFVAVGPEMGISICPDQLQSHMDLMGRTRHRAFKDCVRMERSCDFWKRPASPPVLHHRGSGDDAETGVFREHGDQLVGHTIGKVVLRGISGQVVEGEHSQ